MTLLTRFRSSLSLWRLFWRERLEVLRWGLSYKPIRGGAPDDDDADKGADDKGGSGDEDKGKADDGADKGAGQDKQVIPEGKELIDKDEANRLRRKVSESEKAEKARKRKEAEEADDHGAVVKSVEGERDEEKSKREELEVELEATKKGSTVTTVASRLKFNDPADALLHLPSDTPNEEAAIERALKKLAKEKPYLVGGQGSRTAAPGGGGEPTSTDIDAEIAQAEKDGDVGKSTRLKRQKAFGGQQ